MKNKKIPCKFCGRSSGGDPDKILPCVRCGDPIKKKKVLKIWNGRGKEEHTHLYLAAYSRADAARLLVEVYPHTTVGYWIPELTNYFSEGCWGNSMEGITPERGVWITRNEYTAEQTAPERIYPRAEVK